jgi:hypothetical protein
MAASRIEIINSVSLERRSRKFNFAVFGACDKTWIVSSGHSCDFLPFH